jgi:hypothetical protein
MAGSPLKNLRVFAKLCGDEAMRNVILATTMWGCVAENVGIQRENELERDFWKSMLASGSRAMRFMNTFESAWDIVDSITPEHRDNLPSLLIQEEMVDLHKRLSETQAGITLYNALQRLFEDQIETVRKLREQAEAQKDERLAVELNAEFEKTQEKIRQTLDQIQEMKIPFRRRLRLLFNFGKPNTVSLFHSC